MNLQFTDAIQFVAETFLVWNMFDRLQGKGFVTMCSMMTVV